MKVPAVYVLAGVLFILALVAVLAWKRAAPPLSEAESSAAVRQITGGQSATRP